MTPEQMANALRIEAGHTQRGYLLRNAADLIERQAAEIARLTHERRNIISHGIGGYTKAVDSMNMNDACVAISAFRSKLYQAGKDDARKALEDTNG